MVISLVRMLSSAIFVRSPVLLTVEFHLAGGRVCVCFDTGDPFRSGAKRSRN